jgi:imidazolonepropionase-like amidohydrolase
MIRASFAWAAVVLYCHVHLAEADILALTHAHIISMGPAGEIASGTVLIDGDKIVAVGADVAVPASARVLDIPGRIVTPGFMMVGTSLSITDLPSYGILDDVESGLIGVGASYDVEYAVNPENVEIVDARVDGITAALVTPEPRPPVKEPDMLFGGQSALISTADSDHLILKAHTGITMISGATGIGGVRAAEFSVLPELLSEVRLFASDRQAYDHAKLRRLDLTTADLEALVPVERGLEPLIVRVERASDIRNLLQLARQEHIKLVLMGAEEGWLVAQEIATAGVPVVIDPEANIPNGLNSVAATNQNAGRLASAGVKIAFEAVHARPEWLVRSPRVIVGHLVGQTHLSANSALAALTINAATIAGVEDRLGSIAKAKSADIVVWNADPLEVSSFPEHVFIAGKEQSLISRQQLLGEKYLRRYEQTGLITGDAPR